MKHSYLDVLVNISLNTFSENDSLLPLLPCLPRTQYLPRNLCLPRTPHDPSNQIKSNRGELNRLSNSIRGVSPNPQTQENNNYSPSTSQKNTKNKPKWVQHKRMKKKRNNLKKKEKHLYIMKWRLFKINEILHAEGSHPKKKKRENIVTKSQIKWYTNNPFKYLLVNEAFIENTIEHNHKVKHMKKTSISLFSCPSPSSHPSSLRVIKLRNDNMMMANQLTNVERQKESVKSTNLRSKINTITENTLRNDAQAGVNTQSIVPGKKTINGNNKSEGRKKGMQTETKQKYRPENLHKEVHTRFFVQSKNHVGELWPDNSWPPLFLQLTPRAYHHPAPYPLSPSPLSLLQRMSNTDQSTASPPKRQRVITLADRTDEDIEMLEVATVEEERATRGREREEGIVWAANNFPEGEEREQAAVAHALSLLAKRKSKGKWRPLPDDQQDEERQDTSVEKGKKKVNDKRKERETANEDSSEREDEEEQDGEQASESDIPTNAVPPSPPTSPITQRSTSTNTQRSSSASRRPPLPTDNSSDEDVMELSGPSNEEARQKGYETFRFALSKRKFGNIKLWQQVPINNQIKKQKNKNKDTNKENRARNGRRMQQSLRNTREIRSGSHLSQLELPVTPSWDYGHVV